ncbi:MAG: hypothetical protein ACP5E5_00360 [Acidobacteriaceae bacterium]
MVSAQAIESYDLCQPGLHLPPAFGVEILAQASDAQRLLTVAVAGVSGGGMEAAGEFLSHPQLMEEALHTAPTGWQQKNLEFVLETSITDSVPGPPHVVAAYFW